MIRSPADVVSTKGTVLKEFAGLSVRRDVLAAIGLKLAMKESNDPQLEGIQSFSSHNRQKKTLLIKAIYVFCHHSKNKIN